MSYIKPLITGVLAYSVSVLPMNAQASKRWLEIGTGAAFAVAGALSVGSDNQKVKQIGQGMGIMGIGLVVNGALRSRKQLSEPRYRTPTYSQSIITRRTVETADGSGLSNTLQPIDSDKNMRYIRKGIISLENLETVYRLNGEIISMKENNSNRDIGHRLDLLESRVVSISPERGVIMVNVKANGMKTKKRVSNGVVTKELESIEEALRKLEN